MHREDHRTHARLQRLLLLVVVVTAGWTTLGQGRPAGPLAGDMAAIPAGAYSMGTDRREIPQLLARYHTMHADLFTPEVPRRSVKVNAFLLDRTEVTTKDFARFLEQHPEWQRERVPPSTHNGEYLARWTGTRFPPDEASWPVANVTWSAADAYCTAASKRLPTEQEWEWAARGGLDDPEFPWGNDAPDAMRANWAGAGIGHATPVGSFAPNGYGLFDMAGNVWEFTSNAWPVDPGGLSTAGREGPGTRYAIRGGSYGAAPINLRVRYRDSHPAGGAGPHVGFRCAASPR